jgi:carboxypeptidase Q
MESDIGTFTPYGLSYSGTNPTAQCIVNEVLKLLKPINATQLVLDNKNSDISVFMKKGVPGSSLENLNEKYFYYHHSNGDSMTVEDPKMLDLCTAVWAATSYAFASLDDMLPR